MIAAAAAKYTIGLSRQGKPCSWGTRESFDPAISRATSALRPSSGSSRRYPFRFHPSAMQARSRSSGRPASGRAGGGAVIGIPDASGRGLRQAPGFALLGEQALGEIDALLQLGDAALQVVERLGGGGGDGSGEGGGVASGDPFGNRAHQCGDGFAQRERNDDDADADGPAVLFHALF